MESKHKNHKLLVLKPMPENLSAALKNLGRGNRSLYEGRVTFFQGLLRSSDDVSTSVGAHLSAKLFKVNANEWTPLQFSPSDWPIIEKLRGRLPERHNRNFARLLTSYILENREMVRRVYAKSDLISGAVLGGKGDEILDELGLWDKVDTYSFFHMRLFAALTAHSSSAISAHFRGVMKSSWLRNRFLYAFISYIANNVPDQNLNSFLSYVINNSYDASEKAVVRLLLRDEVQYDIPFALKAYIGLMLHPFDACEILLNHIETAYAVAGSVEEFLLDALFAIRDAVGAVRPQSILSTVLREPVPFMLAPTPDNIAARFSLPAAAAQTIGDFADLRKYSQEAPVVQLLELVRMRASRYPSPVDFDVAVTSFGRWRFTEAGRLLSDLMTTLYLTPRREASFERKSVLRLVSYFGSVAPLMISAPSGQGALSLLTLDQLTSDGQEPSVATDEQLSDPQSFSDRRWILALQRRLRGPQQATRLLEWLAVVRQFVQIRPGYLSGVEWDWFDKVIRVRRLASMVGNPNLCYALLIRQVEERTADAWLRTAIEPLAAEKTLDAFLQWMLTEYAERAIAFVRYFLTTENILLLQLAPNYTAALTGRINALRHCVREYGFSDLMTERQFEEESKALTASILFKNVSGSQFEIAWEIFQRDVTEQEEDVFATLKSFSERADESPLLGKAKVASPHNFGNGRTIDYELENRQWPMAQSVLAVVDAFMRHPSVGIEVLLSTRFRHDTMRREYEKALETIKATFVEGVFAEERAAIVEASSETILSVVSEWLNRRMQTKRPGRDAALFDFAPPQSALVEIVVANDGVHDFSLLLSQTIDTWLKPQLSSQVEGAREAFDSELRINLQTTIAELRAKLTSRPEFRPEDIGRVLDAVSTVVTQTTNALQTWFSTAGLSVRHSMCLVELKTAADGLYEAFISSGMLRTEISKVPEFDVDIPPEHVRLYFDLLDEVFANAIKYGPQNGARVRVSLHRGGRQSYLRFSSIADFSEPLNWAVTGERYTSVSETIFGEGSSGLGKIAALAATLSQSRVTVYAHRRRRSFHLLVPFSAGSPT